MNNFSGRAPCFNIAVYVIAAICFSASFLATGCTVEPINQSKLPIGTGSITVPEFKLQAGLSSTSNDQTPSFEIGNLSDGYIVEILEGADSSCSGGTVVKSVTASGGSVTIDSLELTGGDKTYDLRVMVTSPSGVTSCSDELEYVLDATAPVAPSGWTLSSPTNGATSSDSTPQITITGDVLEVGSTAKVYADSG
ncbi:MAG: hypothetical protein AABZ06_03565, partial [Bdellovibrionota bacterium]